MRNSFILWGDFNAIAQLKTSLWCAVFLALSWHTYKNRIVIKYISNPSTGFQVYYGFIIFFRIFYSSTDFQFFFGFPIILRIYKSSMDLQFFPKLFGPVPNVQVFKNFCAMPKYFSSFHCLSFSPCSFGIMSSIVKHVFLLFFFFFFCLLV